MEFSPLENPHIVEIQKGGCCKIYDGNPPPILVKHGISERTYADIMRGVNAQRQSIAAKLIGAIITWFCGGCLVVL